MTCEEFQTRWFEHQDGTLTATERAAAEGHLANCDGCRRASQRQKELAQALTKALQHATAPLQLRADIRRNIMATAAKKSAAEARAKSLPAWWRRLGWQTAWATAVMLAIAVLVAKSFIQPTQRTIQTADSLAAPPTEKPGHQTIFIRSTCSRPTPVFYREGNMVVDTVVDMPVLASGTLRPGGESFEP